MSIRSDTTPALDRQTGRVGKTIIAICMHCILTRDNEQCDLFLITKIF